MTLSATFDADNAKVTLVVASAPTGSSTAHFERTIDQVKWTDVRGGQAIPVSSGAATIIDYEYIPGVLNSYRVTYNAATSFVAAGTAVTGTGSGSAVTPGLPAGMAVGDLMVLAAFGSGLDTPSGWSTLFNNGQAGVFTRMNHSGDTAPTVAMDNHATGVDSIAQIAAFRGVNASALQQANMANTSAQNVAYPALTAAASGVALILGWKTDDNTSVTAPSGFTQIGDKSSTAGTDASLFWFYKLSVTSGTIVGPGSVTVTGGAAATSTGLVMTASGGGQDVADVTPAQVGTWLKNPLRPFLNRQVTVIDFDDVTRNSRSGVFDVIGRTLPIAVTDLQSGRSTTITMRVTNAEDADDLDSMIAVGEVLLLQPVGGSALPRMYAVPGGVTRSRVAQSSSVRRFPVQLTEVATPDLTLAAVQSTWQTVVNTYSTWGALVAAKETWSDVLQIVGSAADVVTD